MTTSPYTHPSMPGTKPLVLDLSAALEDAEGRKLADDIIARKKYRNIRDRFMQQLIWGDVLTDGHGNVIPRELPDYWASVKEAWDAHVEGKLTHTRALNRPAVTELRGPMFHMTWTDELMTHQTGVSMRVGGRGYGKRAAQIEALRRWNSRPGVYHPKDVSRIGSVRWICPRPTDPPAPVYAVGSYGWAMEQAIAFQSPYVVEHNRKLNAKVAAKVSAIHDILGVTPHGSNSPQVPEDARHR